MTTLALQKDNTTDFNKEFAKIFNALYNFFPQEGKEQAKIYYNRADPETKRETFVKLVKQYQEVTTAFQLLMQ